MNPKYVVLIEQYSILFETVLTPDLLLSYEPGFLADIVVASLPIHLGLTIDSFDDVDTLLSLYPFIYQKLVVLHAHTVHNVRIFTKKGHSDSLGRARDIRDTIEEMLKMVKLQYESLSRRITLRLESRA